MKPLDYEFEPTNCISEAFFFHYTAKDYIKPAVVVVFLAGMWISFVLFALLVIAIAMFQAMRA
jgi:hypothetical protein